MVYLVYARVVTITVVSTFKPSMSVSKNNCMVVCESKILDEAVYFNPNPHNIILIEDRTIHNFCSLSGSWNCDSCLPKCKKRIRLPHILSKIGESSSTETIFKKLNIFTYTIDLLLKELYLGGHECGDNYSVRSAI